MSRSPHPRLPVMSGGREMRSGASARAYYNEIDPAAAHVLRCLIADGLIAPGDVDDRSIKDISPDDLAGYTQCHFFAGAGLWSVAARLAGWPDDRPLWTGSCPCQPFSTAGRGLGTDDPRHLWPDFFRLIRACRPAVVMGEQVAGSPGYGWFDGVRADLAGEGFASRVVDIPACAVDAPHIRQRLWWCAVADTDGAAVECGRRELPDPQGAQARRDGDGHRRDDVVAIDMADASGTRLALGSISADQRRAVRGEGAASLPNHSGSGWRNSDWLVCHDGKARRTEPGLRLLVDGMAGRVPAWRLAGNSISPVLAAEVIGAFLDTERLSA